MPMVRAIRLLNAIEAGTTTGAQLETLLADAGRRAEWTALLGMRGQVRRMLNAPTTCAAIAASARAFTDLTSSSTVWPLALASANMATAIGGSAAAMTVINSSSALLGDVSANAYCNNAILSGANGLVGAYLNALLVKGGGTTNATLAGFATAALAFANATATAALVTTTLPMTAIGNSSAAKLAMWASDTMLGSVAGSATALTALRAVGSYSVLTTGDTGGAQSAQALLGTVTGATYLVLGVSTSNGTFGNTMTISARKTGSVRATTYVTAAGGSNTATALGALVCPLQATYALAIGSSVAQTLYAGMLRCDI